MQNNFDDIIKKLDNHELWDFPGGVFPAERKKLSNQTPIGKLPIPECLYVPIKQHIGTEGHLIVEIGQKVLKGQALTRSMNPFAVPVHAPTSGEIVAIHKHVSAHPSGLPELTVEIISDQLDKWTQLSPLVDYQNQPKMQVLTAICDAGISGMGGAGFPTHIKSSPKKDVDFLIVNGIECEPYITSDDRLMREHAWQIRQGIDVLCHLLNPKQVLIGIENNKPEAIEAMQVACRENPNYRVCIIPTKYPAGGEKQLIQVLTNREVPAQGLPVDVGVIMHNVGTCFAVADAIFSGKPLISRVVTVTGKAIIKPRNVWALIGSPIAHLLTQCEYKQTLQKQPNIIMGGPMMGFSVTSDLVPVVKTTNCILAPTDNEISGNNEQACIRCGACADVCPASLLPQQLFWHAKAKELDKAQDYNLFDCIECGACAYVCPSEIPLVHYYRIAKSEIRLEQEEKQKSDKARDRFEKREARLIAEQQARDEKHRLAAQARKQAMESNGNNSKDKIAAALARAKAKKQAMGEIVDKKLEPTQVLPENKPEPPTKAASSNQRVQAAIARAKAKKQALGEAIDKPVEPTDVPTENKPAQPTIAEVTDKPTKATSSNQRVQAAFARAKAKKAAADTSAIEAKQDSSDAEEEKLEKQNTDVKVVIEQPVKPQVTQMKAQTEVTDEAPKDISPASQVAPSDSKQARIAAAVAKAKAKREALKSANSQGTSSAAPATKVDNTETERPVELAKTEEQQIDMKKRKITAAVAKAKAKKAAEKADKSL